MDISLHLHPPPPPKKKKKKKLTLNFCLLRMSCLVKINPLFSGENVKSLKVYK